MTYDNAMRARFDRVNGGEFRADDLRMLMMYFRQVAEQHRVVREVAHFMSHPNKRDKGLMPDLMFDVFAVAQFQLSLIASKAPIDVQDLPPHFVRILRGARRQLKGGYLKRETRMNAGAINRTLESLESAFSSKADGRMYQARALEIREFELFKALLGVIPINCAFSQDDLFQDFRDAAKSVGFLKHGDRLAAHMSPWLMLISLEAMHHVELVKEPFETTLQITVDHDGFLNISSTLNGIPPHMDVRIGMPIVSTTMRPSDWCTGTVPAFGHLVTGVEVTAKAKLNPLRAT